MADVGRPLLFATPELLSEAIEGYFSSTSRPTLAGLAVHLGIDRQTLYNYAERDRFFDIVKKAHGRVEAIYEERLVWDNAMGVIFPLKNMGWKDKTETELSGKTDNNVTVKIIRDNRSATPLSDTPLESTTGTE